MTAMASPAVRVAVVGHTNTGKTSLLRTLARDARFGEVSDRPATTRDVRAVDLLVDDVPLLRLFDTPGLEDALDLSEEIAAPSAQQDAVAGIEAFVAGDHAQGRFEQEAKVLRQLLASDAALYVIDAREPPLAKHRAELRLLSACGRPILPVLNFIADARADAGRWREQLARNGLHLLAEFDTVAFDADAEARVFDKLGMLLEGHRAALARLVLHRAHRREVLRADACRCIAALLIEVAALRRRVATEPEVAAARETLHALSRRAEQRCVDQLLDLFSFELDAYHPPELPLHQGRWAMDAFDPESARLLGIRGGSGALAGGAAGLGVDAMLGGMSLGAAALIGAGVGATAGAGHGVGRALFDRARGYRTVVVDVVTLAVLATRQTQLLAALLRRGHASQQAVANATSTSGTGGSWPSEELRRAVMRARAHPEWSAGNAAPAPDAAARAVASVAEILRACIAAGEALRAPPRRAPGEQE